MKTKKEIENNNLRGSSLNFVEDTIQTPKVVGGYRFGNSRIFTTQINLTYKPNFIHRFFMKTLLGFYWSDQK